MDLLDRRILEELQSDCKVPLAQLGKRVGLSAPAVMERIRKLEQAGVIVGYRAQLDSQALGLDVTAFIGVCLSPEGIAAVEAQLATFPQVLECHHVTGGFTLLLKAKAHSTRDLAALISRLRLLDGVDRTETLVVLSTRMERPQLPLGEDGAPLCPPGRRSRETKKHTGHRTGA